jgi:hypothetical protein
LNIFPLPFACTTQEWWVWSFNRVAESCIFFTQLFSLFSKYSSVFSLYFYCVFKLWNYFSHLFKFAGVALNFRFFWVKEIGSRVSLWSFSLSLIISLLIFYSCIVLLSLLHLPIFYNFLGFILIFVDILF